MLLIGQVVFFPLSQRMHFISLKRASGNAVFRSSKKNSKHLWPMKSIMIYNEWFKTFSEKDKGSRRHEGRNICGLPLSQNSTENIIKRQAFWPFVCRPSQLPISNLELIMSSIPINTLWGIYQICPINTSYHIRELSIHCCRGE